MESTNLPSNNSNQQLMDDDSDGLETRAPSINGDTPKNCRTVTKAQWLTVAVLCYVNLINYMDRFTMAGRQYSFFLKLTSRLTPTRHHALTKKKKVHGGNFRFRIR